MLSRPFAAGLSGFLVLSACSCGPSGLKRLDASGGSTEQAGTAVEPAPEGGDGGWSEGAGAGGNAIEDSGLDTGAGPGSGGGSDSPGQKDSGGEGAQAADSGGEATSPTRDGAVASDGSEASDAGMTAEGSADSGTADDASDSTLSADVILGMSSCGLPLVGPPGKTKPDGTPGNLRVLNWAGFKAAFSFTFDDANSSQVDHYAELNALGVRMTFFLIGSKVSFYQSAWAKAARDGHELANHTQTHNSMTQTDVDQGKQTIESTFSLGVYAMAAPNGSNGYGPLAMSGHMISRGVWTGSMSPGNESSPSPFNTYCYLPPASAAASVLNVQVDNARSSGGWGCVVVHGFTGGTDNAYWPISLTEFIASVNYAKGLGDMWLDTYGNLGAYWRGQIAFQNAQQTISGNDKTWTWTLPANFPPGKCLRVTVDGGTLQQAGNVLPWDSRGYYEISLDEGSLTLSP